jgi:hypothetical protein
MVMALHCHWFLLGIKKYFFVEEVWDVSTACQNDQMGVFIQTMNMSKRYAKTLQVKDIKQLLFYSS